MSGGLKSKSNDYKKTGGNPDRVSEFDYERDIDWRNPDELPNFLIKYRHTKASL